MKNIVRLTLLFLALFFSATVLAEPVPHADDAVASINGNWDVTITPLFEQASFVNDAGQTITQFPLAANKTVNYGFVLDSSDDFNIAYAITAVETDNTPGKSVAIKPGNKACVFIVTATSPANPDVRIAKYNQATCSYKVIQGKGEVYSVG